MARHLQRVINGWRYYRAVPRDLRAVVGVTAWSKYLGKAYSERDAERFARDTDVENDALIATLRKLPADARAKIAAAEGLKNLSESALDDIRHALGLISPEAAEAFQHFNAVEKHELAKMDPSDTAGHLEMVKVLTGGRKTLTPAEVSALPGKRALMLVQAQKDRAALETEIKQRSQLSGSLELREDRGLGSLLKLAPKYKPQSPKSLKRARTYMQRFVQHMGGDKDPRGVTQDDAAGWRDALAAEGHNNRNQAQQLSKISALFKHAVNERLIVANPFAGITALPDPIPRKLSDKKRRFEPRELKAYVAGAAEEPGSFALVADCLIYSGARSSEICNLLVRDVRKVDGILCFDMHDEVRQLKNKQAPRLVPIPNILIKRVQKQCEGRDGDDWLFDDLPHTLYDSAEHRYQVLGSKIIREFMPKLHNGKDDSRLTAYCTRHTFIQTCDDIGVDEKVCYAIVGHQIGDGDAHSTAYRGRPALKKLKAGIEKAAAAIGKML